MKKQRAPFIVKEEPGLTPGMLETPEEKAEMRRQLEIERKAFIAKGRVATKLPPQPTPVRSDALPRTEDDRLKNFYPMLEEERQVTDEWRE